MLDTARLLLCTHTDQLLCQGCMDEAFALLLPPVLLSVRLIDGPVVCKLHMLHSSKFWRWSRDVWIVAQSFHSRE